MTSALLHSGWELAPAEPDQFREPAAIDALDWLPAIVPGTAAAAWRATGRWRAGDPHDFDRDDWWFRTSFEAEAPDGDERLTLALGGIATVAEVYLNGERVLESESMFLAHRVDIGARVRAANELAIRCRALAPLLAVPRRPRARWRTALVNNGNLRFFRTMLLGRAPGFAPGPAAVGPWKPVALERTHRLALERLELTPSLEDGRGRLAVRASGLLLGRAAIREATVELGGQTGRLAVKLDGERFSLSGEVQVENAERWWPHTHGRPALYDVTLRLELDGELLTIDAGRVGFRELLVDGEPGRDGLALRINGVRVFARGAVWTPIDIARPCSSGEPLRATLEAVRDAGMNMLRIPGTGCYEGEEFHDLCDELGILVWQDFMFANMDYPDADEPFMASVELEARQLLGSLRPRPSVAILCGGSEVAQQVAMLGLDQALADGPLYRELLPSLVAEAPIAAPYVPNSPCGGDLPFRPDAGIANYYGVGAYLRPLSDARLAGVQFAGESLAFSNVPDDEALADVAAPVGHPRWKAGVPRDVGAGWDFEDVRDHYLRLLFGVDPVGLRAIDQQRYLELSRHLTGEVMSEVLGEWRREASPCAGALVLWLRDLAPGAGWGVLDHRGAPKVVYHHLRRALAPVAAWSTDEGLGGVAVHVANDGPEPLHASLRVALYRDLETRVDEHVAQLALDPHTAWTDNVERLLGRFVDVGWSYRFGPPGQDLIAISVERGGELLSQSFRLPVGRPMTREPAERLGLRARIEQADERPAVARIATVRFAYGVRMVLPGYQPLDDAFSVEPGHERVIELRRAGPHEPGGASLSALNLAGRIPVREGTAP